MPFLWFQRCQQSQLTFSRETVPLKTSSFSFCDEDGREIAEENNVKILGHYPFNKYHDIGFLKNFITLFLSQIS